MTMKIKKLALLLPLLPLLMANSPARGTYSRVYEDFEATYVEEQIEDNHRYYLFHINNTGKGFIDAFYVSGQGDYEFSASVYDNNIFQPFESAFIAPNQQVDLKVKANTSLVTIDDNLLNYHAYAYSTYQKDPAVSGTKAVELIKEYDSYCYYKIDVQADDLKQGDYVYLVVKATYDNQEFYFRVSSSERYRFYTSELLDLDKLEIKGVVASISSSASGDDYSGLAALGEFFGRFLLIFVVIAFIVGNILFLTIFLPKIIRKSKQRRVNTEKKQNKEEDS